MTTIETKELRGKPHLKNVLLIQPKSGVYAGFSDLVLAEPLGPEQIAGAFTHMAEDVRIGDERVNPGGWKDIAIKHPPEIVGVTCNYTADVAQTIEQIQQVRRELGKDVLIVVGGHHITHRPSDLFIPEVDAIAIGEGEEIAQDIGRAWSEKHSLENVRGIWYRDKHGKFIKKTREKDTSPSIEFNSPHMNNRPFPRRDLVAENRDKYHFLYFPQYSIETQRGCPNDCNFCSVWPFFGRKVKTESPERTIQEIMSLNDPKYINIIDDSAFIDITAAEKIFDEIIERGVKILFWAQISSETIWPNDPEIRKRNQFVLEKGANAGLDMVLNGLEDLNQKNREGFNKKSTVEQSIKALEFLENIGVRRWVAQIISPNWTEEDFENTIKYNQELRFEYPQFTNITPLPGSRDYNKAIMTPGALTTLDPSRYNFFDWVIPTKLPPEKLQELTRRLYRETGAFGRTPDGKLVNLGMAKRAMRRMKKDVEDGITTKARIEEFNKRYATFLRGGTPEETVIFDAKKL